MDRSILPFERTVRLHFEASQYLYKDHLGREVILDIEGGGRFHVAGPPDATVEIDGKPIPTLKEGVFERSILVTKPAGRRAFVMATSGPELPLPNPEIFEVEGYYEGCGWVVAAPGRFVVDDGDDGGDGTNPLYPTPFFRYARASGKMQILADRTTRTEPIDHFSIADDEALKARNWKVQNISAITRLSSRNDFDQAFERSVASHLNRASWTVAIPPDNKGLILRKLYDRFHGRQRARVLVDGEMAGWWYEPGQDRERRWGISQFGIPSELTRSKERIEIAIDPPGGAPLWSIALYDLLALLPANP